MALGKRELGWTGLRVSRLGFGAATLGNVYGTVKEEDGISSVHEAFRCGINFFDTSPYYGNAVGEQVLGKALTSLNVPREDFVVSSKCGRYGDGFDFTAERVARSVDESLQRLNLTYIDIMLCHDIEFASLDQVVSETIPALLKLKENGKIHFIGISGLPLKIFHYVLDRVPPEKGPPMWHPGPELLKSASAFSVAHCKERGTNISKLALQYALMNPNISSTLSGLSTVQEVRENVEAAIEVEQGKSLDLELLQEVDSILNPVKNITWLSGRDENN